MSVKEFKIYLTKEARMKCPMGMNGDWFTSMMIMKTVLAIWILIVPMMFLRRFDKLLKILEDKKKQ